MLIRPEATKDWAAVHALMVAAFQSPAEARLVAVLRQQARPVIALVAEENQAIVGHLMFSPVSLSAYPEIKIMGLGPMAVAEAHQGRGYGSRLVRAGLERCEQLGFGAAVVLGHIGYYPRFGFVPSVRFGIGCEYAVPAAAFMALELQPGYLQGKSGTVRYHPAFDEI